MAKDIKKLRADLDTAKKAGKVKLDEYNALAGKADWSAEEETRLAALDAELSAAEANVDRLAREIAEEEKASRRSSTFGAGQPGAGPRAQIISSEPNPDAFRSLADFAGAVRTASLNMGIDPRLNAALPANYHQNGGSAGEGFLVPAEYRQQIWELVFSAGDLLAAVNPEPTSSNIVGITKDETTPWGSSGVQAYWRAEAGQMTASKAAVNNVMVPLHELYAFVVATDELLSDAPRLQSRLTLKAADAIRFKASDAIAWGDGVGKPYGFMNSAALVTVSKESGQAADTLVALNIGKMFSRLLPQNLGNAFWMANSDTLPQLMTLTIGNQPIWTPPNAGFANAPGGFLLGRPIMFSEHAKTIGDVGDLTLVDPSGYYAATKAGGGIDFAASIHLYFDYAATAFRWTFRMGGQPFMTAPVSPKNGSSTKSHFVALEAR